LTIPFLNNSDICKLTKSVLLSLPVVEMVHMKHQFIMKHVIV